MYYRDHFNRVFDQESQELALGRSQPYWEAADDAWAPLQGAQDTTIVALAPGNGSGRRPASVKSVPVCCVYSSWHWRRSRRKPTK
jgi:hypothetical protein